MEWQKFSWVAHGLGWATLWGLLLALWFPRGRTIHQSWPSRASLAGFWKAGGLRICLPGGFFRLDGSLGIFLVRAGMADVKIPVRYPIGHVAVDGPAV